MKTVLALFLTLVCADCFGQTFGLGDDAVEVSTSTNADRFGLGDHFVDAANMVKPSPPIIRPVASSIRAPVATPIKPRIVLSPNVPLGYHRHITTDGQIIQHGDWNFGDPVAHANVARPWVKYYGPVAQSNSQCPGGICPPTTSVRSFRPLIRRMR